MAKTAEQRSFWAVGETCPVVDEIFGNALSEIESSLDAALDAIKEKATYKLRDAITAAYEELIDAEERISSLEKELESAQDEIAYLEREMAKGGEE